MSLALAIIVGFTLAGLAAGGAGLSYRATTAVGFVFGVLFVLFLLASGAASVQELW